MAEFKKQTGQTVVDLVNSKPIKEDIDLRLSMDYSILETAKTVRYHYQNLFPIKFSK